MTTLSDLASKLPALVGGLLDSERNLKRGRFREETLTDIFTGALAAFAGPEMIIEYPPEASTGGDLDIDFYNISRNQRLRLRIQAKRLNALTNNGKPVKIKHRAYKELLHKVGSSGKYQFKTLVTSPDPHLPLYMFYNHGAVTLDPYFTALKPVVSGINLAFAHKIADELEKMLAAKPKRLPHKRLSHLRPYFFDLGKIFCASLNDGEKVPAPSAVDDMLRDTWQAGPALSRRAGYPWGTLGRPMPPDLFFAEGGDYRRIPDGPAIRFNSILERPTITFLTGRTEDERTPRISDAAEGPLQ